MRWEERAALAPQRFGVAGVEAGEIRAISEHLNRFERQAGLGPGQDLDALWVSPSA